MSTDIERCPDDDQNGFDEPVTKLNRLAELEGITPEEMFDRILAIVAADESRS